MFVASSGPGAVSVQVEAPGLCIECAHIYAIATTVKHQVSFGERPPSSVQPPWLLSASLLFRGL